MLTANTVNQVTRLFYRAPTAIVGAATYNPGKWNLTGNKRVVGVFHMAAAGASPAAGYPRIIQSLDGSTNDIVTVLQVDGTQAPEKVFPFDETLLLPYVSFEYTDGGAGGTLSAFGMAFPV